MPASRTADQPARTTEVEESAVIDDPAVDEPNSSGALDAPELDAPETEASEAVAAPVVPVVEKKRKKTTASTGPANGKSGAELSGNKVGLDTLASDAASDGETAPKKKPAKPRASRAKTPKPVEATPATSAQADPTTSEPASGTIDAAAPPASVPVDERPDPDSPEAPRSDAPPSTEAAPASAPSGVATANDTAQTANTVAANGVVSHAKASPATLATPAAETSPAAGTSQSGTVSDAPDNARAKPDTDESDEPSLTFESLGLTGSLLTSLREVGYEVPSPIQVATIPDLLAGRDVIAQAQTGSGKTAAFGLPIIESIDPRDRSVQALILCPTRELAIQVAEAVHRYGKHKQVQTLPIYGGQAYERQLRGLQRGVQIVVGTPGRVMDHMRRGSLSLESTRYFVLDEADEMLDMGFIDDVDWILGQIPGERQMSLFSATMPPRIADLARRHMKDPARISVRGKEVTVSTITQSAYEVPRSRKVDVLNRILDAEGPQSAMVFCRTKNGVDELGEALLARGYAVETLHGDLSQAQRDRVMRRFRAGTAEILIATDVAARGLDIPDVSHVINFDIPESTEAYVHRVGRTGRAGKGGEAITLVSPRELRWLRQIERATKGKIDLRKLPTLADVADRRREAMKTLISDTVRDEANYEPYLEVVEQLSEDNDMSAIAAAVLKLYADETGRGAIVDQSHDDLASFGTAQRGHGEQGMTRLFLNIGRAQGIRPQDIVGAIANEANIPGRSIGAIDILDASTFVDVPTATVEAVLQAMNTIRMKGRPVSAEVSNEAPRSNDFGGRGDRGGRGFGGDRGPRQPRGGYGGGRGPRDGRSGFDRDDRGPRRFDRDDRGPRRFDRDDRGPRSFDQGPRRGPQGQQPYRPFQRDGSGAGGS